MSLTPEETARRIRAANAMLSTFSPAKVDRRKGGFWVSWTTHRGRYVERRWCLEPYSSDYPAWHRKFPGGGTSVRALHQLIRWCRGNLVYPLTFWCYVSGVSVALTTAEAVRRLSEDGWPEISPCVLCGYQLSTRFDWWDLDGVTGPCCAMWDEGGCRQKGGAS